MSISPTSRGIRRTTGALAATALVCSGVLLAVPASAAELIEVPRTDYSLFAVSSESNAYPAPPALDGTALGAFDGDYTSQWVSRYADNQQFPHWLTLDLQRSISVKALDYSIRNTQSAVQAKDVRVYVTNDPAVAALAPTAANVDAWGAPAATVALPRTTAADQKLRIELPSAVQGRYVMFLATSNHGTVGKDISAGIGEIRVLSDKALPPIVDPGGSEGESFAIAAGGVTARVSQTFPQVLGYDLAGSTFGGQSVAANKWTVNGTAYEATTTVTPAADSVTYVSKLTGFDATITSVMRVTSDGRFEFEVTDVSGGAAVNTLALTNNAFLSLSTANGSVDLDRTVISPDSRTNADESLKVGNSTPAGKKTASHAFLGNGTIQASLITNATTQASAGTPSWNQRITTEISGTSTRTASLGSNTWLVHPTTAKDARVTTYELPKVTVFFTGDANGDDVVNWQDGAIRYRAVDAVRMGADRVAERVVNRIPFNFASSATNYFDLTLDNTKRIANSTDGLGQWVLNKGFGSEGHDSANTDYGDNWNERAGGLADLNTLVEEGKALNADMSVHVNATEIYLQSNATSEVILDGEAPYRPGWNWLDQSFYINQQADLGTGRVLDRFQQLADAVPDLSGVYIDVYYSNGWVAEELADELHGMGLEVATEWGDKFVDNSVWAHWPNDLSYGGVDNKGINSTMVRFIQNGQADIWNDDVLLGQQRLVDAEGWVGNSNWDGFMSNVWKQSLPTKFIQHFDLMTYEKGKSATLTDNVAITMDGGARVITVGGKTVLRGSSYLLPWQSVASNAESGSPVDADKMYYFSADGGSQTFDLTAAFAGASAFDVFELTDQGRVAAGSVSANNGQLTLDGKAGVAYIVVPKDGVTYGAATYTDGTLLDPGFNSGTLGPWNATGDVTLARTAEGKNKADPTGDNIARFGTAASSLSQKITGLTPGETYSFSAQVEIAADARRAVTVSAKTADGEASKTWDNSPTYNYMRADSKSGLHYQRGAVSFVAPANGEATVTLAAEAGQSVVSIDNARVMIDTSTPTTAGAFYSNDFEGNQAGWGPFVKGNASGIDDPRTSISRRNDPYTTKEWRNTAEPHNAGGALAGLAVDSVLAGNHSLMAHSENGGVVYRTDPTLVNFEAGHTYRIDFNYQVGDSGSYNWISGTDALTDGSAVATTLTTLPISQALTTTAFSHELSVGCGVGSWVGLERKGGKDVDFILDDFTVTDLGETPGGAACATIAAGPGQLNPGAAATFETTFTNAESAAVTNIGVGIELPAGYTAAVADGSSNLFAEVKSGESVSTTWVITAPAEAAGTSIALNLAATYRTDCDVRTVKTTVPASVATRSRIPNSTISVKASSEETNAGVSEGPAALMLDGDASTIWHSRYSTNAGTYPYEIVFDLGSVQSVDGVSYLRRGANTNGPIKAYAVAVSTDGASYTPAVTGDWANIADWQDAAFPQTQARYVKVTALSSISGTPFAAAAEMAIYGAPAPIASHAPETRPADDLTDCEAADPTLTLSKDTVAAGAKLNVSLAGFDAGQKIELWLAKTKVADVTTGDTGAYSGDVTIPAKTKAGDYSLVARSPAGTDLASASLTVTSAPKPVKDPSLKIGKKSVEAGSAVSVKLKDFAPATVVGLWLGERKLGDVTIDAQGRFDGDITIPADTAKGDYSLTAHNAAGAELAKAKLSVTEKKPSSKPKVTVGVSSVTAGGSIEVTLSGVAPGQIVQVWLHSEPVLLGAITADAQGSGAATLTVPAETPAGEYNVVATDAEGAELARTPLTVTAAVVVPEEPTDPTDPTDPSHPVAPGKPGASGTDGALPVTGTNIALVMLLLVGAGAAIGGGVWLRARRA